MIYILIKTTAVFSLSPKLAIAIETSLAKVKTLEAVHKRSLRHESSLNFRGTTFFLVKLTLNVLWYRCKIFINTKNKGH